MKNTKLKSEYKYEQRKLSFQLVPQTAWYTNLRSILPNWSEISNAVRQSDKCECCGKNFDPKELEAHEVWEYDDEKHTQSLKNIIAVCKNCHNTIHIGHASVVGKAAEGLKWYMKVNNISKAEAAEDIKEAFEVWEERSQYDWDLDEEELKTKVQNLLGISCDFEAPIDGKYYANVSYEEKELAKELGAKWDFTRKLWYFNNKEARETWDAIRK